MDLLDEQFLWFKLHCPQPLGDTTVSDQMRRVRLETGLARGSQLSKEPHKGPGEEPTVAERKMPRPDKDEPETRSRRCR